MIAFLLASIALAAPPEEIRIGSPGSRGAVLREHVPGVITELLAAAGDVDGDGKVQLSDAVHILAYLFLGTERAECLDAADGNDDGRLQLTDAIYLLSYLFLGGRSPPPPFPAAGRDPTEDDLGCRGSG